MYGMTPDCDGVYRNWHVTPWGTHKLTKCCPRNLAQKRCDGIVEKFWRYAAPYALKKMKEARRG